MYQKLMFTHTTQQQQKKQCDKKMGRGYEQIFLQRRYTDGKQTHEKMFNIANHQGIANQNQSKISPYTCQNGKDLLDGSG